MEQINKMLENYRYICTFANLKDYREGLLSLQDILAAIDLDGLPTVLPILKQTIGIYKDRCVALKNIYSTETMNSFKQIMRQINASISSKVALDEDSDLPKRINKLFTHLSQQMDQDIDTQAETVS